MAFRMRKRKRQSDVAVALIGAAVVMTLIIMSSMLGGDDVIIIPDDENGITREECLNLSGRVVDQLDECHADEVNMGDVMGFVTPNICCTPNENISYTSIDDCNQNCLNQGYMAGNCKTLNKFIEGGDIENGGCFILLDPACGRVDNCKCYCQRSGAFDD